MTVNLTIPPETDKCETVAEKYHPQEILHDLSCGARQGQGQLPCRNVLATNQFQVKICF